MDISKTIEILVGIPCSGKSTYANFRSIYLKFENITNSIISRDDIRENKNYFNQPYIYSNTNEDYVTKIYNKLLKESNVNIIIFDNTHCKEKYIDEIINKYSNTHKIYIVYFDISLFNAHYRNIIRYFNKGKWIPFKIINNMYKNYKQINKEKYAKYLVY